MTDMCFPRQVWGRQDQLKGKLLIGREVAGLKQEADRRPGQGSTVALGLCLRGEKESGARTSRPC